MTGMVMLTRGVGCGGNGSTKSVKGGTEELEEQNQVSLVELLIAALRKSMVACRVEDRDDGSSNSMCLRNQMEIGWPTNVQHLTHVTFDRFHGFLGLPLEFQVEIPSRVPSARYQIKSNYFYLFFYFLIFFY